MFETNLEPRAFTPDDINTVKINKEVYVVDYFYTRQTDDGMIQKIRTADGQVFEAKNHYAVKTAKTQRPTNKKSRDAMRNRLKLLEPYGFSGVNAATKLKGE